jgi:hypothetical protein
MGFDVGQVFAFMSEKASSAKDKVGDFSGDFNNKAQGAAEIAGNMFRTARVN